MTKIIAANWKMNHSFDEADAWLAQFFKSYADNYEKLNECELVLAPPAILLDYLDSELMEDGFSFLEEFAKKENRELEDFSSEEINEIVVNQRPIKLSGQDCHFEKSGSFTGDISAKLLRDVGCKYVILGHSERRCNYCETSEMIAKKLQMANENNLIAIFCVGESKEIRDAKTHLDFVQKQIKESLLATNFENLVIAYEPVWSIGSGVLPSVEEIVEMVEFIKKLISDDFANQVKNLSVLYGGSVNAQNSGEILKVCDGLLVGKASLEAGEFVAIAAS
jgi:triosephosphate isomerase